MDALDVVSLILFAGLVIWLGGYVLAFVGFVLILIIAFIIVTYNAIVNTITTIYSGGVDKS